MTAEEPEEVNGEDVERRSTGRGVLSCRTYAGQGVPPAWMVEAAILRALNPEGILFLCVANAARSQNQPIAIFTLGMGAMLNSLEITFCGYGPSEYGANILKRLANTYDSDTFHPLPQPTGLYCYADITVDPQALDSCFNAIASAILRLAM